MPDYLCEQCGNSFKGFPGNANRFCSRSCYWEAKQNRGERKCPICHKVYLSIPSKRADFCSIKCFRIHQSQNSVDVPCLTCGKIVHRWKTSIHKSGNVYCSRKCATEAIKKPGWKETPDFKLHANISRMIRKTLTGTKKYRKWEKLVGYKVADLKAHLEKQFSEGMSWKNYGLRGWHIDHKVPRTAFNFKKTEDIDFMKCWSLKNLQPMWGGDNIRKGNRLEEPFQPSFSF